MKQKVPFSLYCKFMTALVIVLFAIALFTTYGIHEEFVSLTIIVGAVILISLFYCPLSVEVTDSEVNIHRPLRTKALPLDNIKSVDTFYPSAGGLRLCGSGGFAGFWGHFNDIMCGSYFGYYGRRDSCFLVKMTDGRQYVLGCENPKVMVDYINSLLKY